MPRSDKLTFREISLLIAEREGKKQEVNIAQINEILRITLNILADEFDWWPYDTIAFLKKYQPLKGINRT